MNRQQAEGIVDAFEAAVKSRSADNAKLRDNLRTVILDAMCEERSYPITMTVPESMSWGSNVGVVNTTWTNDDALASSNVTKPLNEVAR